MEPVIRVALALLVARQSPAGKVSFEVPGGAVSMTLVANGGLGVQSVLLSRLIDPTGADLTQTEDYYIGGLTEEGGSTLTVTLPFRNNTPPLAGRWEYGLACRGCSEPATTVFWKTGEATRFNVHVVVVSSSDIDDPATDPGLQEVMNHFYRIYGLNGLGIGSVVYSVVDSNDTYVSESDRDGNGQPDAMDRLFTNFSAYGVDNPNDYLHVFFVESIGDGSTLGWAGGIPAPPIAGTPHSGLIMNSLGGISYLSGADRKMMGETIAHELGHYLGLYHTTEEEGQYHDPITDTPECRGDTPSSCPDGSNLMFVFAEDGVTQEILTEGQRSVLRKSQLAR
jgi:hypothetical protein